MDYYLIIKIPAILLSDFALPMSRITSYKPGTSRISLLTRESAFSFICSGKDWPRSNTNTEFAATFGRSLAAIPPKNPTRKKTASKVNINRASRDAKKNLKKLRMEEWVGERQK